MKKPNVTISMNYRQAEMVRVLLKLAIKVDGKREWTNAALRRMGGVLKTLEAAIKDADERFLKTLMKV